MTSDDVPPTREELLTARADLQAQLDIVSNPQMSRDLNPSLVAKLEAMIADIDACLADMKASGSQREESA
jgi:hypothetical protein